MFEEIALTSTLETLLVYKLQWQVKEFLITNATSGISYQMERILYDNYAGCVRFLQNITPEEIPSE